MKVTKKGVRIQNEHLKNKLITISVSHDYICQ